MRTYPLDFKTNSSLHLNRMLVSQIRNNTVFIVIDGIGTKNQSFCNSLIHGDTRYIFEIFNYDSKNMISDMYTAVKDLSIIRSEKDINNFGRQARLTCLISKIKRYLTDDKIDRVITIGISHGSIIMHGAVLSIKNGSIDDKYMNKLNIWTLGSPRYIPQTLLPLLEENKPRILNFYNTSDSIIRSLCIINKLIPSIQVPNLHHVHNSKDIEWTTIASLDTNPNYTNPRYYYSNGIVYIKHFETYSNAIYNNVRFDSKMLRCHASYFNFFPILDENLMFLMQYPKWEPPECHFGKNVRYQINLETNYHQI